MYSDKKVILLGENIPLENFNKYNVVGIVGTSNSSEIQTFPYELLADLPMDTKIIIVDDEWEEKRIFEFDSKMKEIGLSICDDYIYNSMLGCKLNTNIIFVLVGEEKNIFMNVIKKVIAGRKAIVLHGNCQTHALRNILSLNKEFARKYVIYGTPRLWVEQDENLWELFYNSEILKLADILFSQEISTEASWGYNKSLEYISSQVSDKCHIITIPKLYFMGYFPQLKVTHMKNKVSFYGGKIKWPDFSKCIDREILKLILDDSGGDFRTAEEIVEIISTDDYFKQNELLQAIESELEDFETKEKNVEIKMCDFLKNNYDKFLMFVTNVHPTKRVLEELAKRILKRLHIEDLTIINNSSGEVLSPMLPENVFTVYPSVLRTFGFSERMYSLPVSLWGVELPLLMGIEPELDEFINKNRGNEEKYSMTLQLDFKQYMLLSIRVLQAAIHV